MTPEQRLQACLDGSNPRLITRLESGFVEMSGSQFLPGYCLLLADPLIGQLNDLPPDRQAAFLRDMALVGDAVKLVTGAVRVNYGIYGNVDPFLHAHIWPRFADEVEQLRTTPPLAMPAEHREADRFRWSLEQHGGLQAQIRSELERRRRIYSRSQG